MPKIVFKTGMDNSGLEKDLKKAKADIERNNREIAKAETAKMPFVKQLDEMTPKLDSAKQKLHSLNLEQKAIAKAMLPGTDPQTYINAAARKKGLQAEIKAQEKTVNALQKKWDGVVTKVEGYDAKIKSATEELKANKSRVGVLESRLSKGGVNMAGAMQKVEKSAHSFERRIAGLAKRILVFSIFASALRGIKNYMSQLLNSNEEYRQQLAQLKGALITAFQPIYEFILPGLLAVMRVITMIVQGIARVLSALFGKSAKQSAENAEALNKEAQAIKGVGGAAKEATRELAGFDQINRLGSASGGGGGGGGGAGGIAPDFSAFEDDGNIDRLRKIAKLVASIAAGLAAWKIASLFTNDLKTLSGIALAVGGAFLYAFSWADAFENGVDWENLTGMVGGALLMALGLALAFGAIGGAAGLAVGGIGLIIAGLKDFHEKGEMTWEDLSAIDIGLLLFGAAAALISGAWIPLIIAAIGGLVLAIVTKGDEIKGYLDQFLEWCGGIWSTDFEQIFGHELGGFMNMWADASEGVTNNIILFLKGLIDFIQGIFTLNWAQAWGAVVDIFDGLFGALADVVIFVLNIIVTAVNTLLWAVNEAVNGVVGLLNKIPGVNIPVSVAYQFEKIPYLAKGAVLPPNKPFMAMVGDQTHGTNIEAPLDTIKQAVAEVIAGNGGGGDMSEIISLLKAILAHSGFYIDGKQLARFVNKYQREIERSGG